MNRNLDPLWSLFGALVGAAAGLGLLYGVVMTGRRLYHLKKGHYRGRR